MSSRKTEDFGESEGQGVTAVPQDGVEDVGGGNGKACVPVGADSLDRIDVDNLALVFGPELLSDEERARELGITSVTLRARQRNPMFVEAVRSYGARLIGRLVGMAAKRLERIVKGDDVAEARKAAKTLLDAGIAFEKLELEHARLSGKPSKLAERYVDWIQGMANADGVAIKATTEIIAKRMRARADAIDVAAEEIDDSTTRKGD